MGFIQKIMEMKFRVLFQFVNFLLCFVACTDNALLSAALSHGNLPLRLLTLFRKFSSPFPTQNPAPSFTPSRLLLLWIQIRSALSLPQSAPPTRKTFRTTILGPALQTYMKNWRIQHRAELINGLNVEVGRGM